MNQTELVIFIVSGKEKTRSGTGEELIADEDSRVCEVSRKVDEIIKIVAFSKAEFSLVAYFRFTAGFAYL